MFFIYLKIYLIVIFHVEIEVKLLAKCYFCLIFYEDNKNVKTPKISDIKGQRTPSYNQDQSVSVNNKNQKILSNFSFKIFSMKLIYSRK